MKAIVTKYHGPSAVRGSRISATAEGENRVVISYGHEGNEHLRAAQALCKKMGWEGSLVEGGLPDGNTVFVFMPKYGTEIYPSIVNEEQQS
jgi:hypothetical protein